MPEFTQMKHLAHKIRKGLPGKNTLAYHKQSLIMDVKKSQNIWPMFDVLPEMPEPTQIKHLAHKIWKGLPRKNTLAYHDHGYRNVFKHWTQV
jgi:hypothetical protein